MFQDTQQGQFWLSDKPEHPVAGTLTIEDSGTLRLTTTAVQNNSLDTFLEFSNVTAEHQPRTEPAIEVLSRLAIRVSPDLSETILDKALECCRDPRLLRGTSATVIRHLLERSWEALPEKNRHRSALDLMNAPIAGLDSEPPLMEYAWADPVELFANDSAVLRRTLDNEPRIPHLAQTSDAVNRQLSCFSSRYMNLLAVFQI